jgi:hypothetical protein
MGSDSDRVEAGGEQQGMPRERDVSAALRAAFLVVSLKRLPRLSCGVEETGKM